MQIWRRCGDGGGVKGVRFNESAVVACHIRRRNDRMWAAEWRVERIRGRTGQERAGPVDEVLIDKLIGFLHGLAVGYYLNNVAVMRGKRSLPKINCSVGGRLECVNERQKILKWGGLTNFYHEIIFYDR
jgi:hypothetical protein